MTQQPCISADNTLQPGVIEDSRQGQGDLDMGEPPEKMQAP